MTHYGVCSTHLTLSPEGYRLVLRGREGVFQPSDGL